VIPQISSQNTVVMSVSLEVSSVQEFRGGVPVTSSSKADSKLLATNGMPLVIGGLITDQNMKSMDGVPGLSRLPLVGGLFRDTRTDRSQRELVLVIVPSIVGGKPLAPEPTLTDVLRDVEAAPYLRGEAGEGETPAGGGVPFKGKKSEDAAEGK
jgi:general secretion pathway protein D